MNNFKEWIEQQRNYNTTIDNYIQNSGTIVLYRDSKYMLTRVDTPESTAIASIPTELCLAFPTDKSIGFENPIDEINIGGVLGHNFASVKNIPDNTKVMGYPAKDIKKFITENK